MTYRIHTSKKLVSLFKNKPYQGANPENSKVIILGNDANYSQEITEDNFFNKILEYHADGVEFWKKYNVHHPFLLDEYPLKKSEGGVPYHKKIQKLGFDSRFAKIFSFVELLNVPTIGSTSENMKLFYEMLDKTHLEWLEDIVFSDNNKLLITNQTLAKNIRKISKIYGSLKRLNKILSNQKVNTIAYKSNNLTIYNGYSFSYTVTDEYLSNLSKDIEIFISENDNGRLYRKKYIFNDSLFSKGRLVLTIVKSYVNNNPGLSYNELLEAFPPTLQGGLLGVFVKYKDAKKHADRTNNPKHFLSDNDIIELSDFTIAVTTHWGMANIDNFVDIATSLGYTITDKKVLTSYCS